MNLNIITMIGLVLMTSVKNNYKKLKGEVGMAIPKSTQTRVVGIITYMVHHYVCFSRNGRCKLIPTQVCLFFYSHNRH